MSRRVNDGDRSGMKMDKFKNSRFENDVRQDTVERGVSRKTLNTLGGAWEDNRGRRSADSRRSQWDGSPFDDGKLDNWKNRKGWDEFYEGRYTRGNRNHGGSLRAHDAGGMHIGKGPRGYKRADDSIYEDVCGSLSLSPDVDASNIEVSVKEGIVYLTGTVESREQKKMAEFEIESISGVIDVQNGLTFNTGHEELH